MKQNDIVLIFVCVFIGGIFSFIVSSQVFGSQTKKLEAETVEKISSEFTLPDQKYFNERSFNYTQQIQIGNGNTNVQFGQ